MVRVPTNQTKEREMKNELFEEKRKSYIEIGEIFFWTVTINKWQHLVPSNVSFRDVDRNRVKK